MKTLRLAEAGFWIAGCAALGSGAIGVLQAHIAQVQAASIQPGGTEKAVVKSAAQSAPGSTAAHEVVGRLEIQQVALSVPVLAGYDPATLVRGVGHVFGTAVPGGLGNMVLAGHRDTYFRPLRHVRTGMEIVIVTTEGRFVYVVDSTEVVMPDAVKVLDIGDQPSMTLITCYPFEFIGAAPQRFIVHAHLVSDPG